MLIEVYNLTNMLKTIESGSGVNILSIRDYYSDEDTESKYARLDSLIESHGVNARTIYFDDIDPYRFKYGMEHISIKRKFADPTKVPRFFNPQMAKDIVAWVMGIWEQNHNATIQIHCWAGRSRSQAVAYWLNMYFNLMLERNMAHYLQNNTLNVGEKIHFNCEVLRVFTRTFTCIGEMP